MFIIILSRVFRVSIGCSITLLLVVGFAHAQDVNDPRVQELLRQISALQDQLSSLQNKRPLMQPAVATAGPVSCPMLSRNLSQGMRGEDVRSLQTFLVAEGVLTSDSVSGYFGRMTETAVQSWQRKKKIVFSGTPTSTGYGIVGERTRVAILGQCNAVSQSESLSLYSNALGSDGNPQQISPKIDVYGAVFTRGDLIPIAVTIGTPIPYEGAEIRFRQQSPEGNPLQFFPETIAIPKNFSGVITHTLDSAHIMRESDLAEIAPGPYKRFVGASLWAPFFEEGIQSTTSRLIGLSSAVGPFFISEDTSTGTFHFYINNTELSTYNIDMWRSFVDERFEEDYYEHRLAAEFQKTMSRANAIDACRFAAQIMTSGRITCAWNTEDITERALKRDKKL